MANEMEKTTNFDAFWSAYPNKTGKGAARTAYDKQEKAHGDKMDFLKIVLAAVATQKKFRQQQKAKAQWVANWKSPATWINQECFCDEMMLDAPKKGPTIGAQCAKCTNPVMGPRFTLCSEHEAWQTGKTLVEEMSTMYNKLNEICHSTEDWRNKYRELAKTGLGGRLK